MKLRPVLFLLSSVLCATLGFAQVTIPWTDVDKTGSSLADLTTRSAADLSTGTLANARLDSDLQLYAAITPSANVQSLLGAADYSAMRTQLGLVIGTNVQAYDAELAAIAGLISAADRVPYFTGSGTAALATFTSQGRSLVASTTDVSIAGNLTFGTSGSVLNGTTGSIGLTATGTNQNITLTPTGNGNIVTARPVNSSLSSSQGFPAGFESSFWVGSASGTTVNALGVGNGSRSATMQVYQAGSNTGYFAFGYVPASSAFVETMRVGVAAAGAGNLLLGTATDSSNGKLQLATHTTSAGGIGFGTDTPLYRQAASVLEIGAANAKFRLNDTSNVIWSMRSSAGYLTFGQDTNGVDGVRYSGSTLGTGKAEVLYSTASTSTTTGALTVAGGVGITGAVNIGGQSLAATGAVGTPSISFSNDANTGFYSAVADGISVATGGVNNATITEHGWRGPVTWHNSENQNRMMLLTGQLYNDLYDCVSRIGWVASVAVTGGVTTSGSTAAPYLQTAADQYLTINIASAGTLEYTLSGSTNGVPAYGNGLGFFIYNAFRTGNPSATTNLKVETLRSDLVTWDVMFNAAPTYLGGLWVSGNLAPNGAAIYGVRTTWTFSGAAGPYYLNEVGATHRNKQISNGPAMALTGRTNVWTATQNFNGATPAGTAATLGANGAGDLVVNSSGSTGLNLLVGTGSDSSNGRVQVSAGTLPAQGLGFGSDSSIWRGTARTIRMSGVTAGSALGYLEVDNGTTSAIASVYSVVDPAYASSGAAPLGYGFKVGTASTNFGGLGALFASANTASPTLTYYYLGTFGSELMRVGGAQAYFPQTTASTSTTTGALTVAGGIGVAGAGNYGGTVTVTNSGISGFDSVNPTANSYTRYRSAGNARVYHTGTGGSGAATVPDMWYVYDETAPAFRLALRPTGEFNVLTNVASTSTTTGSLIVAGGAGIAGRTSTATLNVGGTNGTTSDLLASNTATLDFGSINAAASADLTITVTGANTGDSVALGLPASPTAGIIFQGFVSAANTVTVRATNITGSPVDPASATYRATVTSF